jgi:hypothetical protein
MSVDTFEGDTCMLIDSETNKYSCKKCLKKHYPDIYEAIFLNEMPNDMNSDLTNRRRKF